MVTHHYKWSFLGYMFGTIDMPSKVTMKYWTYYRPLKGMVEQ
jgi:hypothetical protein